MVCFYKLQGNINFCFSADQKAKSKQNFFSASICTLDCTLAADAILTTAPFQTLRFFLFFIDFEIIKKKIIEANGFVVVVVTEDYAVLEDEVICTLIYHFLTDERSSL